MPTGFFIIRLLGSLLDAGLTTYLDARRAVAS